MTKVISLSDEAYSRLKVLKREGESFSGVVLRTTAGKQIDEILKFAGAWKDKEELDRIFKQVEKERHATKFREFKL